MRRQISLVRACVVKRGVYLHFADTLGRRGNERLRAQSSRSRSRLPFSCDRGHEGSTRRGGNGDSLATFTVRLGRTPFRIGMAALTAATSAWRCGPLTLDRLPVVCERHLECLAVLWFR